eukprot:COSAG06_NODE_2486_length_6776_cov_5.224652_1_plen_444_part_00
MEVLAAVLGGVDGLGVTNDRHVRLCGLSLGLTGAQVISSLLSGVDWASDFAVAREFQLWGTEGHTPNEAEFRACIEFVSTNGTFVNGTWSLDGDEQFGLAGSPSVNTSSVDGGSLAAAVAQCAEPRMVEVPDWLIVLMYGVATYGAVTDVVKAGLVWKNSNSASRGAAHYRRQDARHRETSDAQQPDNDTTKLLEGGKEYTGVDNSAEVEAEGEGETEKPRLLWYQPDFSPWGETKTSQKRTKTLGLVSGCGVVVEDVVQASCTLYAEMVLKANALVVATGGLSTVGLLSLGFGLANAVFKVAEGIDRCTSGMLADISSATFAVHLDGLPATQHDRAIEKLAHASELRHLHVDLRIADAGLTDDWAQEFGRKVLPHLTKLKELFLSNNQIGDGGGAAIGEGLKHCPNLEELKLQDNQIGEEAKEKIREVTAATAADCEGNVYV